MYQEKIHKIAFDEYTKEEGGLGRFDPQTLQKGDADFLNQLIKYAKDFINAQRTNQYVKKSKMPYVHFEVVDDLSFNASAFVYKGKEFITINAGTFLILHDLFSRILGNKNTFPGFGITKHDTIHPPLPFLTTTYVDIQAHYDDYSFGPLVYSRSAARQDLGGSMVFICWMFLVGHELAHLRYGHVHYVHQIDKLSFLLEAYSNTERKISKITSKVLEWQADNWSAIQSTGMIFRNIKNPHFLNFPMSPEQRPGNCYYAWGFAMWVLFRLMDVARINKGLEASLYYPSHSFRQFGVFNTAVGYLDRRGRTFKSEVLRFQLGNIVTDAERALTLVSNLQFDISEFLFFLNDTDDNNIFNHTKEYHEHWNSVVKPALELYSRGKDLT